MRLPSLPPFSPSIRGIALSLTLMLAACSSPEERAQAHYESGEQLLKDGDYPRAGLEFRNALNFNDKLAAAWLGLADVEEKNENWGQVLEALKRTVELDDKNAVARARLAKLQFVAGELDNALKNVNAADELRKDDPATLSLRAAILFRLSDREGAESNAERALALDPDNADAYAVLAAGQMLDKNKVAALRDIERGLEGDPSNLGLLLFKLKIHEEAKEDAQLEAVLRQIISYHPKIREMRQALLQFLNSRKRFDEAEAELRAMIAAEPGDTGLVLDLVRFVGRVKNAAAARAELERTIAAHPEVNAYRMALAELDFSEKKTDAAVAALDAIIAKGEPKEDVSRARIMLASLRLKLKDTAAGKALIDQVLEGDAKNPDALSLRAGLKLDGGDADGAIADLREALNQRPQSAPLLIMLATAHERQGTIDLAIENFNEAVKIANFDPRIVADYTAFLQRHAKGEKAEETLDEALKRHPEDRGLLVAMSRVKIARKDWEGAQKIAETLKKLGDGNGVGDQILGASLIGQRKFDESIALFRDSQAAAPDKIRPMKNLVAAYIQAGKPQEAETFLETVLKANGKNAEAYVLLGLVKNTQKKTAEAEASFRKAIELQPASPLGYVALAKFQTDAQQFDKAEETLKAGRAQQPTETSISLALAGLLERRNDIEGAIKIYEEQLKATPDDLIITNNLASLLADYRSDEASFKQAHDISRRLNGIDLPAFKDTLGWVAYRRGDYQTAFQLLSDAAAKAPDYEPIRYHLAMTHLALKRPGEAREILSAIDAVLKDGDPLRERVRAGLASAKETKQEN